MSESTSLSSVPNSSRSSSPEASASASENASSTLDLKTAACGYFASTLSKRLSPSVLSSVPLPSTSAVSKSLTRSAIIDLPDATAAQSPAAYTFSSPYACSVLSTYRPLRLVCSGVASMSSSTSGSGFTPVLHSVRAEGSSNTSPVALRLQTTPCSFTSTTRTP